MVAGMSTGPSAPGSTGYVHTGSAPPGGWPSHAPPGAQHRPQAQQHAANAAAHPTQAAAHMPHPGRACAPVHGTSHQQPLLPPHLSQQHAGMPGQSAPGMLSMSAQSSAHMTGTMHADEQQGQQGQMKPGAVRPAPSQAQQQQPAHHQSLSQSPGNRP